MKIRIICSTVILIAFVTLPFTFIYAASKPVHLRYNTFFPPSHIQAQLAVEWGNEIEKRTNGQVKFSHFSGGSLLKGPEIFDAILKGITDVGMSVLAYNRGRFPGMEAIDLPLGYPDAYKATEIINEYYEKYKFKELKDVKILYLFAPGPALLHSKKAVNTLEDMKGLKVRTTGTSSGLTRALGGVSVSMPQSGTYEALQKGVVDATWIQYEGLKGWRQGEVIKYTIECQSVGFTQGFYVAMNRDSWNSLPKDVQDVITEVSTEWKRRTSKAWGDSDEEGMKFSLSLGNKIIKLSDREADNWVEAVQPVIEKYISTAENRGFPGREYINFIKDKIKESKK